MKKMVFLSLLMMTASAVMLFGGDNNSNISTGYLRSPVRNSVINNIDAVIFNPAGTIELEDGFHLSLQNEILFGKYSYDEKDLSGGAGLLLAPDGEANLKTYLLPTIMMNYNQDDWSAYFSLTVPGGGGTVNYDPWLSIDSGILAGGAPSGTMLDVELEASSWILGYTLGGAWKFFDLISVSAGARVLQSKFIRKVTASGLPDPLVDAEFTALGVGGIFGINIMPIDNLNIAMRYESQVKMDYKAEDSDDDDYSHDYPAYFGLGIGYRIIPKLNIMTDFGFNFYKLQAEESDDLEEDNIDNAWTLGIGAEYDFTDSIMGSAGVVYTDSGINEDSASATTLGLSVPNPNPDLGRITIGVGGLVKAMENLDFECGYMLVIYRGEEDSNGIKYEKSVQGFSLGATYRF